MQGNENEFLLPQNSTGFVVAGRLWTMDALVRLSIATPTDTYSSQLRSVAADYLWPIQAPATAESPLLRNIHSPFALDKLSNLGIFACALYKIPQLEKYYNSFRKVTGLVAMWGEVIAHTGGYRSQYAYPLTLDHSGLAEIYKVEYVPHSIFKNLQQHLKNWEEWKPHNDADLRRYEADRYRSEFERNVADARQQLQRSYFPLLQPGAIIKIPGSES